MKTPSLISMNVAGQHQGTFFFVWKGSHQELLDMVHTPQVSDELHTLLGTHYRARVWCPNDEDRIVTLMVHNKGTIVSS